MSGRQDHVAAVRYVVRVTGASQRAKRRAWRGWWLCRWCGWTGRGSIRRRYIMVCPRCRHALSIAEEVRAW